MFKKVLFLVFVMPASLSIFAQYNFTQGFPLIYSILNTKCQNAGCHSATSAEALKFDSSPSVVWSSLVGQQPTNTAAQARGEQLVWIDQPYQSYLLKKANGNWFDSYLNLPSNEMDSAHAFAGLTNMEVEYIRQWILDSAARYMADIDTSMINDYYNDTARAPFFPVLTPPASGSGQQVRYGPIFLRGSAGHNEVEYMLMRQVNFPEDEEVIGLQGSMSSESHHFLLFQFPDTPSAMAELVGLRRVQVSLAGTTTPFDGNKQLMGAWQNPNTITLPTGTAFFWPKTTFLDQDFHIKNYTAPGTSGILPFDFYLNIYTRPRIITDNTIQMVSNLANNVYIVLLPHMVSTLNFADPQNGRNETRYIWMLSSHTHKFGVGFNIYEYDASKPGGLGDTLYDGLYDYAAGVPLGVYDWEHPSIEYFQPQRAIDYKTNGMIAQTTYNNDSSNIVTFGFTTANEMQLYYYMYTRSLPGQNAISTIAPDGFDFIVAPNPMTGNLGTIAYYLESPSSVQASIIDIAGKEVATLNNEQEQKGNYTLDLGGKSIASGMYFARLTVNGNTYTKKFIVE